MVERESVSDEVLIQELLEDICYITLKIKKELDSINNLVRENGEFSEAVAGTNHTLLELIKARSIDLSFIEDESENSSDNNVKSKSKSNISKKK